MTKTSIHWGIVLCNGWFVSPSKIKFLTESIFGESEHRDISIS